MQDLTEIAQQITSRKAELRKLKLLAATNGIVAAFEACASLERLEFNAPGFVDFTVQPVDEFAGVILVTSGNYSTRPSLDDTDKGKYTEEYKVNTRQDYASYARAYDPALLVQFDEEKEVCLNETPEYLKALRFLKAAGLYAITVKKVNRLFLANPLCEDVRGGYFVLTRSAAMADDFSVETFIAANQQL